MLEDYFTLLSGRLGISIDISKAEEIETGKAEKREGYRFFGYKFYVTQSSNYLLRVKISGKPQLWTIDGEQTVEVTPDPHHEWTTVKSYTLSRGLHFISIAVPQQSKIEAIEFDSRCTMKVEPPGGWKPGKKLTFADKSATMAKVMDIEHRLPIKRFHTLRRLSRGGEAITSEDKYIFEAKKGGVYTISINVRGSGIQHWFVDGCPMPPITYRLSLKKPVWYDVATVSLDEGVHVIRCVTISGAGNIRAIIAERDSDSRFYVNILKDIGYEEGLPTEYVKMIDAKKNIAKMQLELKSRGIALFRSPHQPAALPPERLPSERIAPSYQIPLSPILP
jgi:hypothetical protein